MAIDPEATERMRRQYDAYAARYDRETDFYDRLMLGDARAWACGQARGRVLEVAVGTGRNLGLYPPDVSVLGVDISAGMLRRARRRRAAARVALVQGDAQALPCADGAVDTVLCTLGLSSVPDDAAAVAEMHRVLRPGGRLILVGHVASPYFPLRILQRAVERATASRAADRQTRQVAPLLRRTGFTVVYRRRDRGRIMERTVAAKL
ncbi:class I SAM-dependent methyltransferase [Nocardiopsis chromatogenes]|uniref:class I SAM-dependent methyltransferase n=1 Tax=Nocardiopsis chromatogenes TaxID=280239 RepID=UPI000347E281|nr:class I SAM-dependent methyltransferase [Nocardiopsis chromatogenes]